MSGTSYRLDETYVKVGGEWKYLYRAIDSTGQTIEFMLSAKRDVSAAKRFFKKLMRADHRRLPFTIGTDKHASYPEAFATSIKEKVLPKDCKLRRVKYLNNIINKTIEPSAGGGGRCNASAHFTPPSGRWRVLSRCT
jgi:transposase-like protein